MKKKSLKNKKEDRKFYLLLFIFIVLILLTIMLFPLFKEFAKEETRTQVIEYIRQRGILGILIALGIQVLQVVVAFIPGEVVEIISGVIYGTFGGYLVCALGVILGSSLIFFTVKKLGYDFVQKNVPEEKLHRFKFLHDAKKLDVIVFILFFIPGAPKDLLTYIVPLTDMKLSRFLVISSLARIPSIISSTYAGATLYRGDLRTSIIIFIITGTLGVLGIIFNEKIIAFIHRFKKSDL